MSPTLISIPCTFCHATPSERNLTFANSPKSQKGPWTLSQIHHSYIFQTLGILPKSDKSQLSLSFPSCANCVQDFQEIDKHFKTIANILKGVKKRCEAAKEKERKPEEILGIKSAPGPKDQQCASSLAENAREVKSDVTVEEILGIKSRPDPKEQRCASTVAEKGREVDTVEEILGIKSEPEPVSEEEVESWPLEDEGTSTAMPPPPQSQGKRKSSTSSSSFSCSICDAKCSSRRGVTVHMKIVHREKNSCTFCGKSFTFDWQLRHHRIEDHGVKTEGLFFPCPVAKCKNVFATERKLSHHQRVKHGVGGNEKENPQPFSCDDCHETFSNRRSLKRHMTIHVPNEDFAICPVCNKIVTTSCFPIHMMRNHVGDSDISERTRRECYFCQETFEELQTLETHLRIHTRERPFFCPNKCGKDFTRFSHVQKHLKTNRCGKSSDIIVKFEDEECYD